MAERNGNPDIQAGFAVLRDGFARKIPARIADIRQHWERLQFTPEDHNTYHLLHRKVHSLAGTAATYGFEQTGRLAREIETTLQEELTEEHTSWKAAAVDKIHALLVQLEGIPLNTTEKTAGMDTLQAASETSADSEI